MEKPEYQLFKDPVDPVALGIPDYFKIIKNPMDLTTLGQKLASSDIKTASDLYKVQSLIWENCRTYNGYASHSYFYNTANRSERDFVKRLATICPIGMQLYKRMFVKPLQLKPETGNQLSQTLISNILSKTHKPGDQLQESDYQEIIKMLLKLPETVMIEIIQKYFQIENIDEKESFDLKFSFKNDNFAIKFENEVIQKLKEIAEFKAKNKRVYRKRSD